jgi:hypothetical protein
MLSKTLTGKSPLVFPENRRATAGTTNNFFFGKLLKKTKQGFRNLLPRNWFQGFSSISISLEEFSTKKTSRIN